MDDWEKFSQISLPEKEDFYSHLNMEGITDADYVHTKTYQNICLEISELGPARFHSEPSLAWQAT